MFKFFDIFKVKLLMEVGQIGETGVHVNVITALELELGTEADRVPTLLLLALDSKLLNSFSKLF